MIIRLAYSKHGFSLYIVQVIRNLVFIFFTCGCDELVVDMRRLGRDTVDILRCCEENWAMIAEPVEFVDIFRLRSTRLTENFRPFSLIT